MKALEDAKIQTNKIFNFYLLKNDEYSWKNNKNKKYDEYWVLSSGTNDWRMSELTNI